MIWPICDPYCFWSDSNSIYWACDQSINK
ncbi:hypothetical protein DFA_01117 [Cavenderia fasciculata]|uniref:Uncharacterized protein n=1 Tax=Cavenderia fasciculata TaxID=261658 RepID=F4PQX6_CACFS|nr:hypothetical protein DFA_01117 [Cavenderia fasciculata]EGG21241.1 hypothetical protein DFA_01117 [Cavenderia fasciculata]|eukprot:XP_004359091.1 hypothetical protein DFA_01117 [Cavenderia fasciculata]